MPRPARATASSTRAGVRADRRRVRIGGAFPCSSNHVRLQSLRLSTSLHLADWHTVVVSPVVIDQRSYRVRVPVRKTRFGHLPDDQHVVADVLLTHQRDAHPALHPDQQRLTCARVVQLDASANRSAAVRENRSAMARSRSSRTWITRDCAARNAVRLDEVCAMLKHTRGGSAESEASDVAVKPTGPESDSSVITETPAAWRRINERKAAGSIAAGTVRLSTAPGRAVMACTPCIDEHPRLVGGRPTRRRTVAAVRASDAVVNSDSLIADCCAPRPPGTLLRFP